VTWYIYKPDLAGSGSRIGSSSSSVIPHQQESGSTVPIGYAVPGVELYVLDNDLHPVASCTPGQLFVSGPQLALGYLNRPEQTARAFLPNPFSNKPGYEVMYATGDLVRWLPAAPGTTSCLEYLGRLDHQVKLRGFRIELQVRWHGYRVLARNGNGKPLDVRPHLLACSALKCVRRILLFLVAV
jgi:hypothetical protein